jgi:hypothetical protein
MISNQKHGYYTCIKQNVSCAVQTGTTEEDLKYITYLGGLVTLLSTVLACVAIAIKILVTTGKNIKRYLQKLSDFCLKMVTNLKTKTGSFLKKI